jgi:hypothetical protein
VSPRLASDPVRVLRAQRQRDPALSELRARLVRDRITDTYLVRELNGGRPLDAAELAHQVGTTTKVARQWLHTLRAARSGDPRLAGLRAQPASHGHPTAACGVAGRLRRRRPTQPRAARPTAGESAGAHRAGMANPRGGPRRAPRPRYGRAGGWRGPRLRRSDPGGPAGRGADHHPAHHPALADGRARGRPAPGRPRGRPHARHPRGPGAAGAGTAADPAAPGRRPAAGSPGRAAAAGGG